MSKRKTGQAVSLFPFLAVLVSAMGALILLLLVTTRKLHQDAVAKAKSEKAAIEARLAADAESAHNLIPLPLPEDHPAFQTDAALYVIAVKSPSQHLLPPPAPPDRTLEKEQLRREWEDKLAKLREKWDSLQQRLREAQRLLGERQATDAALQAELARLQEILNKLRAEKGEVETDKEKVLTSKKSIAQQIAELQAELERLKAEKLAQANKFQLVPYAGLSPTRSRPIIIECDTKSLRFASEEIALSPRDISGFTPDFNPLLAGTEALLDYWSAQRTDDPSLPKPYLLYVIRPGGTVAYYVAKEMLYKLACESGYELVPDSTVLVWPATTPDAKENCQNAVNEALNARDHALWDTRFQFEGQNGEFIYFFVEQLRRPNLRTFGGGERITRREPARTGGNSMHVPPTDGGPRSPMESRISDLKSEPSQADRLAMLKEMHRAGSGHELARAMPPRAPGQVHGPRSVTEFLNEGSRRPSSSVDGANGRGTGTASGEATSSQSVDSLFGNLLSKNSQQPDFPKLSHHPPTNGLTDDSDPDDPENRIAHGADGGKGAVRGGDSITSILDEISSDVMSRQLRSPLPEPAPGSISQERVIDVTVDSQIVRLGQQEIRLEGTESHFELGSEYSKALRQEIRQWGRAPKGFHWQPTLQFHVLPGGNLTSIWLQSAAQDWGMRSTVEYEL